jgi:hypothetical protein
MTEKMDSRTASCVGMTEEKVGKNKKTSSKPKR